MRVSFRDCFMIMTFFVCWIDRKGLFWVFLFLGYINWNIYIYYKILFITTSYFIIIYLLRIYIYIYIGNLFGIKRDIKYYVIF